MNSIENKYLQAVEQIKTAILQSQYKAIRLANQEQLKLYFSIGRFISANSRSGYWGTGALGVISAQLKKDVPGLMGFSESSLRNMRKFYEAWSFIEDTSATAVADLQQDEKDDIQIQQPRLLNLQHTDNESIAIQQVHLSNIEDVSIESFLAIPFIHHIRILEKVKDLDARLFYIQLTASSHMSKTALLKAINDDEYHHCGALPNNFLTTFPDSKSARRAIRAFKDEYLLDFINLENLDAGDIEDVDERILENEIVENIRNFILRFGKDFLFIGNQYTVEVKGHIFKIDLLFYNRELASLVAVELKRGPFKTAYLGQLNGYLTVLDDYVRKPSENPSIGLVLCKSADKAIVQYLIKDYNKPMGVATFHTIDDMPEKYRNTLPDIESLKRLL
jgi:predicted nuclease of restriction endonuclease-like (RecB) superfamily